MGFLSGLGFGNGNIHHGYDGERLFPLSINEEKFIRIDVMNLYKNILTDCLQRTSGIPEDKEHLFWDNCLGSEMKLGVVSLLAESMYKQSDLFIAYDKATKTVAIATPEQEKIIRADLKAGKSESIGLYVSFKNYSLTDILKVYSALEYCTVSSLNIGLNVSLALQFKIDQLRASVGALDSERPLADAKKMTDGLKEGKSIAMDSKDMIETAIPNLTSVDLAMVFIDRKRSLYLGLPASYVNGEGKAGMSDTGAGDAKAVERGLLRYFFSIIKPVVDTLLNISSTFKSEDYTAMATALDLFRTMEGTSNEFVSMENKIKLVNKVLGLPENATGDPIPNVKQVDPTPAAF